MGTTPAENRSLQSFSSSLPLLPLHSPAPRRAAPRSSSVPPLMLLLSRLHLSTCRSMFHRCLKPRPGKRREEGGGGALCGDPAVESRSALSRSRFCLVLVAPLVTFRFHSLDGDGNETEGNVRFKGDSTLALKVLQNSRD